MLSERISLGFRGFFITLSIFIKHYRQAPLQASAILVGVVLAVTLFVGVQAINENAKRSYSDSSEQLSARAHYQVVPSAGQRYLSENVYFDLRELGVDHSLPVIEGRVTSSTGERWRIQGSDLLAALSSLQSTNEAAHNPLWASQIPLSRLLAGDPIVLVSQAELSDSNRAQLAGIDVEVIKLDESSGLGNRILMDISFAQRLLNRPGQLSYIALFSSQLPSGINDTIQNQALVVSNDSGEDLEALTDSFHLNLTAMSLLAFLVGLFIAYNGVRYSLLKRDRLLMQLQHLGIKKKVIFSALVLELVFLVVVGSAIGFVLGLQLSHWLHPLVAITLEQLYSATLLPGQWQVSWLLQATALSLVAALTACSAQFVQMVNTPLSRSVGYYQTHDPSAPFSRLFKIGLVIGAIACIGVSLSVHYRYTLLCIGLFVVSVPMLLPSALQFMLQQLSKANISGLLGYALAEAKELIAPLSLAMMAMLLAVSSNIAINTLVGSFESTLRSWLEGRLHAEVYISPAEGQSQAIANYLDLHPQVTKVYHQNYLSASYQGLPINIGTKDQETLKATTLFKSTSAEVWPTFLGGKSVFISEPMAVKLDVNVGETVAIPFLQGQALTVGGVFYDYGNPKGEVLIAPQLWNELGFNSVPSSYGVAIVGDRETFKQSIGDDLDLLDSQVIDQQRLKQLAITIFSRTFAITQALNVLTLMVAAIGLFTACYLIGQSRQSAVAKLFCLGVKRRKLRLMLVAQMMLLVGLTCIVALPIGYLLGMLLTENVTLQAFGWTLFFEWDWAKVLLTITITLIASALATLLPLWQQTQKPLVASLQSEVL